jgi:hypothetical protein
MKNKSNFLFVCLILRKENVLKTGDKELKKRDRDRKKKERKKQRTDVFLRRLVINLKNGARLIPICRSSKMIT